ncbi:HAD-IA family hydrolase [Niallia sp.]|uniref:HAD family hydrolase n=1 Tax=Niallia sp. TaxID=2837523 RepID=UPI002899C039|nr:HAD-IA family hydrolase [Niallia sp.]
MIKKPIRGIFFDLGWTIFRPSTGDWKITEKALEFINLDILHSIPKDRRNTAFIKANECLKTEIYKKEAEEFVRYSNYYKIIAKQLPELKLSEKQAEIIAYDRVYNNSNYVFYDDAKKTIECLKEKYKIGLISDTDPSIVRVLKNEGFYDYFDNMTFNFEIGENKPSSGIFENALKVMNLPANETLFIDDYEKNLDSASYMGIQSILILSKPNSQKSSKYPSINKLSDLLLLL